MLVLKEKSEFIMIEPLEIRLFILIVARIFQSQANMMQPKKSSVLSKGI